MPTKKNNGIVHVEECILNILVTLGGGGAWKKTAFLRKVRLYCTVGMNLCL